ncbi:zinc finger protein 888-like [Belonocnema kinseyi]|uniref:zinc finger protein 888-like n=1 Tax=Belonocnema kinseyi TaxID=2817044 RepID=UPI00143D6B1B|nr:zinc finger protein 888-like [Belonocnema kinseyi]
MLAGNMKQLGQKKQYIQNLELEVQYKCKKCARSYKEKKYLTYHQKYECDVTPQFACNFCGKLFKRKYHVNAHEGVVHLKSNSKTSKAKSNAKITQLSHHNLFAIIVATKRAENLNWEPTLIVAIENNLSYETSISKALFRILVNMSYRQEKKLIRLM